MLDNAINIAVTPVWGLFFWGEELRQRPWFLLVIYLATNMFGFFVVWWYGRETPRFLRLMLFIGVIMYALYSVYVTVALMHYPDRDFVAVFLTVVSTIAYWSILFHWLSYLFGPWLTRRLGQSWVKCIDYIYLIGSTVGLLRVATSGAFSSSDMAEVDAWGVVVLGIALSLRLTKTTIEILGWDKPRAMQKPW